MYTVPSPRMAVTTIDWTSKLLVALYASLATSLLWAAGIYLIGGRRIRVRLVNKPAVKAPKPALEVELHPNGDPTD